MTLPPTEDKTTAALRAMNEMQVIAAENGLSEMTLDEINAEITAARNTAIHRPDDIVLTSKKPG